MKFLVHNILNIFSSIVHFISVIIWPLLIVYILYKFKNEFKELINRISTVHLPGGVSIMIAEQQMKDVPKEKNITKIQEMAEKLKTTKDINKILLESQNNIVYEKNIYLLWFHFEKHIDLYLGANLTYY